MLEAYICTVPGTDNSTAQRGETGKGSYLFIGTALG